ncbi:hypothetical protein IC232_04850 [Microvirga sp. BT688]|uniref:hypothetical protein n=1 Tax=Microvirga sp. TaxID=1873136 RepID=UPI0016820454|nr:hypothetical protein [Microvirga sp.]MBD2746025.1 hypothetical protein [Microvirga sp.]
MNRILRSYIVTMSGPDNIDQTINVQVESLPNTPMLDDAGDILQAAQKRCAAAVVDYDSFNSDSEYLNTLDARAAECHVVSIRKPGDLARYIYEGYVGENDERVFTGPVLAVDADEADFAARWGIALQAGTLRGKILKDPDRFFEALDAVEVRRCEESPVGLPELVSSARALIAAHDRDEPTSDLIDELAVLIALVPSQTPEAAAAAKA